MSPNVFFLLGVFVSVVGAYFIANAIAQRVWKEKIPQKKLIGFLSLYIVSFLVLGALTIFSAISTYGFGR